MFATESNTDYKISAIESNAAYKISLGFKSLI